MKSRKEEGFTGVDISIAIIILFIFVSIIATLSYQMNSAYKEIARRGQAIEIAVEEIEKIKNERFEKYQGLYTTSTTDSEGNNLANQPIEGRQGFTKNISIKDYTEIAGNEDKIKDVVKKATVKIAYKSKGEEQTVELSTILSKDS